MALYPARLPFSPSKALAHLAREAFLCRVAKACVQASPAIGPDQRECTEEAAEEAELALAAAVALVEAGARVAVGRKGR